MATVTIIMYHYVRKLASSRFPNIKALDTTEFKKQLDYLSQRYQFVTVEQCLQAISEPGTPFPSDAVLLTFDDGYLDHFTEVFPLLDERNIQGAFFPPAQPILEGRVLDVNKIHFILASASNPHALADDIFDQIKQLKATYDLRSPEAYWQNTDLEDRYDSPEVVFVKRMLQRDLPILPRKIIIDFLFQKYLGQSEAVFARELYMTIEQLKCMQRQGMYIGGHGYAHQWLNTLSDEEQKTEIRKTKNFLGQLGVNINRWVMCYPYGAYDSRVIRQLKQAQCAMGLTTEVSQATLKPDHAFTLQRIDANDVQHAMLNNQPLIHIN